MAKSNALILNEAPPTEPVQLMQAITSEKNNLLKIRKFVFSENKSDKTVSKREFTYYHSVRLVTENLKDGKTREFVTYQYRIPRDLPKDLWKKEYLNKKGELMEWARIKVFERINRIKSPENSAILLERVKSALAEGHDPFTYLIQEFNRINAQAAIIAQQEKAKEHVMTLASAIEIFLKSYVKGSSTHTMHRITDGILKESLEDRYYAPLNSITTNDLADILTELYEEREWSKSTYNDKVTKFRTMFGFFKKRKLISVDPSIDLTKKTNVKHTRHTYYDDATAIKVKDLLNNHEMQPDGRFVANYCEVIYYTCTRPVKETRQLKCEDILWDRNLIYINPERAKGEAGGYIPLCDELRALLMKMRVHEAPGDWYIFGRNYVPGPVCMQASWFAWFYREKMRKPAGLSGDYTPYGWKHTRIIDLYSAGAKIVEIQQLCRHQSPSQTEEYLRDLGLLQSGEINKKTKKF